MHEEPVTLRPEQELEERIERNNASIVRIRARIEEIGKVLADISNAQITERPT